jgi:hypothetical protein
VVFIPSPLNAPKKPKTATGISFSLRAVTGDARPKWERGFNLASTRKTVEAEAASLRETAQAKDAIHRAVLLPPVLDAELSKACTRPVAFQDSDGVELSEDDTCVMNNFFVNTRQAVLSANWVHRLHESPTLTWNVKIRQAQFDYGDIFLGLTEASSFRYRGRSIAFDVRGNFWVGWRPQDLSHKFRAKYLTGVPGSGQQGTLDAHKECNVSITADLQNGCMTVAFPNGAVKYPLENWDSARMFVSFSSPLDTVCMCDD